MICRIFHLRLLTGFSSECLSNTGWSTEQHNDSLPFATHEIIKQSISVCLALSKSKEKVFALIWKYKTIEDIFPYNISDATDIQNFYSRVRDVTCRDFAVFWDASLSAGNH